LKASRKSAEKEFLPFFSFDDPSANTYTLRPMKSVIAAFRPIGQTTVRQAPRAYNTQKSEALVKLAILFCILFVMALATTVHASTMLTGDLINSGAGKPLALIVKEAGATYQIEASDALTTFLRKLGSGDSITAQGTVSGDKKKFSIDSVDRLGLKELLGTWRSSRYEIFEFQDFTQLNLYIPTVASSGDISLSRTHSLKYAVMPEDGGSFTIFMKDDSAFRMAFMDLNKNKVNLKVFDSNTGQVSDNISLSLIQSAPQK
jgi:hypothetical protein